MPALKMCIGISWMVLKAETISTKKKTWRHTTKKKSLPFCLSENVSIFNGNDSARGRHFGPLFFLSFVVYLNSFHFPFSTGLAHRLACMHATHINVHVHCMRSALVFVPFVASTMEHVSLTRMHFVSCYRIVGTIKLLKRVWWYVSKTRSDVRLFFSTGNSLWRWIFLVGSKNSFY